MIVDVGLCCVVEFDGSVTRFALEGYGRRGKFSGVTLSSFKERAGFCPPGAS